MKIELELEIQEAVVLLGILNKAISEETNPNVKNTLKEIINEIESDSSVSHYILDVIKDKFRKNHLTQSEIFPDSDMRWGLGISEYFLEKSSGLTKMAYDILLMTVKKFKPTADLTKVKKISNAEVKKCILVFDLMNLIEKSYEKV